MVPERFAVISDGPRKCPAAISLKVPRLGIDAGVVADVEVLPAEVIVDCLVAEYSKLRIGDFVARSIKAIRLFANSLAALMALSSRCCKAGRESTFTLS